MIVRDHPTPANLCSDIDSCVILARKYNYIVVAPVAYFLLDDIDYYIMYM